MNKMWVTILLSGLGAALHIYLFYPGGGETDLKVSFAQALAGKGYDDRHPPIIAAVWRVMLNYLPGQLGFFFADVLAFWLGLGLISLWWHRRAGSLAWIFLGVGLWPPLSIQFGAILKDLQQLTAILLAFGLLLWALEKKSRVCFLLAFIPLCYSAWAKKNGIVAALPLCIWSVEVLRRVTDRKIRGALPLGLILTAAIWGFGQLIESRVLQAYQTNPQQIVWSYDLVGASVNAQKVLVPPELGAFSLAELRRLYDPLWAVPLFYSDVLPESIDPDTSRSPPLPVQPEVSRRFPIFDTEAEVRLLREAWFRAWLTEPIALLTHKATIFKHLLGIDIAHVCEPYHDSYYLGGGWSEVPQLSQGTLRFWMNRFVTRGIYYVRNTILFRPWFYVLSLGLISLYLWKQHSASSRPFFYFSASALLHTSSFFMATAGCVFRYALMLVLATLLMLCAAVCVRFGSSTQPQDGIKG